MTPNTFDAALASLVVGFALCLALWALSGPRRPPHDQIRRRILTLARQAASDLPEPADSEVCEMMTDARLAPRRSLYPLYVLALGQALLKARRNPLAEPPGPEDPSPM